MTNKTVFQTVEDRNNPDEIEKSGPFPCRRSDAWVGPGYYFWDTFIENAHWWGSECAGYNNGYVICKAEFNFNIDECFDLVGETEHIIEFNSVVELMKSQGLVNSNTTVSRIIVYIKDELKIFKYKAIRIQGMKSKSMNSNYNKLVYFNARNVRKPQYLDLYPAIQICFFNKNAMNLRDYKIVYPDEYVDGYAV